MSRIYDVAALGEILIDFTETDGKFTPNPGGAPANVLAMLRQLGKRCAFFGTVGQDMFGDSLVSALDSLGIDTGGLMRDARVKTTLAFVHTLPGGDRAFSFYRDPGADMMLRAGEVNGDIVDSCRVFHFGTLSMTAEPVRTATVEAVERAKRAGALLSFDPNLRLNLSQSPEEARAAMEYGLSCADIAKISDNEVEFLIGERDYDYAGRKLQTVYPNLRLLMITAGADGSYAFRGAASAFEPACKRGGVIETTGAGDTFCGCMLNAVLERGFELDLHEALRFANHAAYIVTTRRGALMQMPEKSEVEAIYR